MDIYNWWGRGRVGLRFGTKVWGSGFQGGRLWLPGDTWQCLETVLIDTTREWNANGIEWVEVRDAAKHSTIHRAAPPNNKLSAPNCQSYPDWETRLRGVGGGMVEAGIEATRRKNVLTRTTRLTQVKSKVLAWRQCGREMMGLSKRVGNLAVPPDSMDPSLVNPRRNAGGVSSTASAQGSLHLLRTKQKCKGDQWSWGGNGHIGCPAW